MSALSLQRLRVLQAFAGRPLSKALKKHLSTTCVVSYGGGGDPFAGSERQLLPIKTDIGKREVVGYGMNGEESYIDNVHAPFPAIRFKEDTPEILKLKEKEKGEWKKLTLEEKKILYRASFCQTIIERIEPTGDLKSAFGMAFFVVALGFWGFIWIQLYVYAELPWTVKDEDHKRAMLQRMLDLKMGPVEGLASEWDYEKEEWKK